MKSHSQTSCPKTLGKGWVQAEGSTCAQRPVRPSARTADLDAWAAGLYRGVGITLLRDVPSHGVYFGVYDWTRDALEPGCRAAGHQSHTTALIAGELSMRSALSACSQMHGQNLEMIRAATMLNAYSRELLTAVKSRLCHCSVGLRFLDM